MGGFAYIEPVPALPHSATACGAQGARPSSEVYLKNHTSMGRTYTLNKKDSKLQEWMVGDAMKKKL